MDDFGIGVARAVATRLAPHHPDFKESRFVDAVRNVGSGGWVSRISSALRTNLPDEFSEATKIMLDSLGPEWPPEESMPEAHSLTPFVHFVATYGTHHFELTMRALHELSKRTYTAQAGVRILLATQCDKTMHVLGEWGHDSCPHVRRMVVNATRPRLRYAVMPGLSDLREYRVNPEPVLVLLDNLRDDSSETVRRAVAGSLSDIAKDCPDAVFDRMERWLENGGKGTRQIARKALRYASRNGDPRASSLIDQARTRTS